jgi:hypothetical protein
MGFLKRVEEFRRKYENMHASSYQSFPAQPNPHGILLVFKEFDYSNYENGFGFLNSPFQSGGRSSSVGLRAMNSIELPFPTNLSDSTGLRTNAFERDPMAEMAANKINSFLNGGGDTTVGNIGGMAQGAGAGVAAMLGANSAGGMMGAAQGLVKNIMGTDVKDVASAATYFLRDKLPGQMASSIDLVTGQTLNPRETMSFEGVDLRSHSFSWDLYPSNQDESDRIRKITRMIKRNSLPEVKSIASIPKAFLNYPATVDLYLIGVNTEYFIKYKTAMVTSFNVDYGPGNGVTIMKGGKPGGVNLQLGVTELEIETAHDYGSEDNDIQTANYELQDDSRGNVP